MVISTRENWYLGAVVALIFCVVGLVYAIFTMEPTRTVYVPFQPPWYERNQTLIAGAFALCGGLGAVYAAKMAYAGAVEAAKRTADATIAAAREAANAALQEARESRAHTMDMEKLEFERTRAHMTRDAKIRLSNISDQFKKLTELYKIRPLNDNDQSYKKTTLSALKSITDFIDVTIIPKESTKYFSDKCLDSEIKLIEDVTIYRSIIGGPSPEYIEYRFIFSLMDNIQSRMQTLLRDLEDNNQQPRFTHSPPTVESSVHTPSGQPSSLVR